MASATPNLAAASRAGAAADGPTTGRLSLAERDRRWNELSAEMRARGFDALVFVGSDRRGQKGPLRYVADYDLVGRHGYAVLAPGADPVCVLPRSMAGLPLSAWVEDSRFPLNTAAGLCEVIKELPSRERIGIVGRDAIMSIGEYEHLRAELPETEFLDASEVLDTVRAQKSEEEVRGLQESAWIADQCHQRLLEVARPGMTERALNAELLTVMAELGGEEPIFLIMSERMRGDVPRYRAPRDQTIAADQLLMFSIELVGPMGYWVELCRMVTFVQPSEPQELVHRTVVSALEAGSAAMRPGTQLGDIHKAISDAAAGGGLRPSYWSGHAIGHDVIEAAWIGLDVVEATEADEAGAPAPVSAGMAFALHPWLAPDPAETESNGPVGYMANTYVVDEDGAAALSRHSLDLVVLG